MILSDVMDEIAARLDTIDGLRVHAYPADNVAPPAAVVTYPGSIDFDSTYARGMDRIPDLSVVVLVGKVSDRASRDRISAYVNGSGASSIKAVLEDDLPAGGLDLPGVAGSYASTPDHASLDITGDIDLRVEVIDVTPSGINRTYISKWTTTGNQRSYMMRGTLFGTLDHFWSTTGANELSNFDFRNNSRAYRTTLDVNDGAGGRVISFYSASTIDGPWTLLAANTVAGTTSIFAGTAPLAVGAYNAGATDPMTGRITRAQVRDGIDGTIVANPDFRFHAEGTPSFVDSTGKTWTVQGDANIAEGQQFAYTAFDTVRVVSVEFDIVSVAAVEHLAATLTLDITGSGA